MTAVTIKFCIYVFLVENDKLFINKTISPSEGKTKQFPFFFFFKINIVGKTLFNFRLFVLIGSRRSPLFCFNFQVCVFAGIYVSLHTTKVKRCTPDHPNVFFFSERWLCVTEISTGGNPAAGAAQDFCVGASSRAFHPSNPCWGGAQGQDTFLSLITDLSWMQVTEIQTCPKFCPWL